MSKMDMKALRTRILSALVLIPVVIYIVIVGGWPFYIMLAILAAITAYEWVYIARHTRGALFHSAWGAVYLLIGFGACVMIREYYGVGSSIMFLLMVWSADIGAFFCGQIIGGKRLAPSISPNKTISGFVGGAVISAIVGMIFFTVSMIVNPQFEFSIVPILFAGVIGVIVGIVGQAGDLLESKIKRMAGVKDTGTIIPGHGGLLDRVDSMLMAAPVFYMIYSFFSFGV